MSKEIAKLEKAAASINKEKGKVIAFTAGAAPELDIVGVSTGIGLLDAELGIGGLPKGRIIEIYGQPSSTKTSMALFMIGAAQKAGLNCMFVDAEFALDLEHASKMGVDLDKLMVIRPDCGEEALEAVERLVNDGTINFVVVDSVSALVPRGDVEADIGTSQMGSQARLLSYTLRKLIGPIGKQNAIVVFINQLRVNIMGGQYDPWSRPGGQALRFYTSVVIELKKTDAIKRGEDTVGYGIKFSIKKNKVGKPAGSGELDYYFDRGFEGEADLLSAGVKAGVIQREGNSYIFEGVKLGVGREKARASIDTTPGLKTSLSSRLGLQLPQSSEMS